MTTENLNPELQVEVKTETQNPGDVTMGEQERQDQNTQPDQPKDKPASDNKKGTRTPYDGSKWHGVSTNMDKLKDIGMATNALERLEKRFNYLITELRGKAAIIDKRSLSYAIRDKAYEEEDKIKLQIKAVLKLRSEIEIVTPKLENAVKGKIDSHSSLYIDSYKF